MIILNTTFHIHVSISDEFLRWVRESYFPSALASGLLTDPVLARLLIQVQEDAEGYAVQLRAASTEDAARWHDGEGDRLRRELTTRFGQRLVFFTTYMEELPVS